SFFFACHNNFLEEVAKFRAARRLWASLMREQFGAKKPQSWMLRFHTQTAGVTLTAQQPENNIVRVALQALAAILGGTQSLHTNSRDEALGLPTEESARIALRTQQIIGYESGAADVVDPLGGSYYVERLTDQLEEEGQEYLARIESLGGMLRAIEMGYVQKEIQEAAYREQGQVERHAKIVVGLNEYVTPEDVKMPVFRVDPRIEDERRRALEDLRRRRDTREVERTLAELDAAARGTGNLIPPILAAVKAYATIGEICNVLRAVFGEHRETITV
ncbi:MAG: methylmalonyl-CoA mutase family protein, partial [Candidatus Methylomirabilales bacterium]